MTIVESKRVLSDYTVPANSKVDSDALTDVRSGGNKRLTLNWWKLYLDSCASYHTFFVK